MNWTKQSQSLYSSRNEQKKVLTQAKESYSSLQCSAEVPPNLKTGWGAWGMENLKVKIDLLILPFLPQFLFYSKESSR